MAPVLAPVSGNQQYSRPGTSRHPLAETEPEHGNSVKTREFGPKSLAKQGGSGNVQKRPETAKNTGNSVQKHASKRIEVSQKQASLCLAILDVVIDQLGVKNGCQRSKIDRNTTLSRVKCQVCRRSRIDRTGLQTRDKSEVKNGHFWLKTGPKQSVSGGSGRVPDPRCRSMAESSS